MQVMQCTPLYERKGSLLCTAVYHSPLSDRLPIRVDYPFLGHCIFLLTCEAADRSELHRVPGAQEIRLSHTTRCDRVAITPGYDDWTDIWRNGSVFECTDRHNQNTYVSHHKFCELVFTPIYRPGLQKATAEPGTTAVQRIMIIARDMWKMEGFRSFYKGITPRVMRVAPGQAIVFAVYERVNSAVENFTTIQEDDGYSE
jgi:hypothetical protein